MNSETAVKLFVVDAVFTDEWSDLLNFVTVDLPCVC